MITLPAEGSACLGTLSNTAPDGHHQSGLSYTKRFSVPGVGDPIASGTSSRHLLGGVEPRGYVAGGHLRPRKAGGAGHVPAAPVPVSSSGLGFFVGPLLGILDMGEQVRCLLRRESGCPCGLRAVPCRPQVGGVGRLLVGLRSRPGHTERDVCAGGRGPGGTSDSWALLHRRATCPRALYGDGMSSRLGPRE